MQKPKKNLSNVLVTLRKQSSRAHGYWEETGTMKTGEANCPIEIGSMPLRPTILFGFLASMATCRWQTQPHSKLPASTIRRKMLQAEQLCAIKTEEQPEC